MIDREALAAIGTIAARAGAHVLVDEVYLDAGRATVVPAATLGPVFISSLASLRCGWTLSSPAIAERIRRARDVIDGSGAIIAERLAVVAFDHLDALAARASKIVAANVAVAHDFVAAQPRLEAVLPDPTTVIFPRLRGVSDTAAFADRLFTRFDTAVVPGRFFEAPAHIRVGLGTTAATLRGGLERLASALAELD
jgi:aspartate/methionine/tyrosine aminotransferase